MAMACTATTVARMAKNDLMFTVELFQKGRECCWNAHCNPSFYITLEKIIPVMRAMHSSSKLDQYVYGAYTRLMVEKQGYELNVDCQ
jgi:hypothetical protein